MELPTPLDILPSQANVRSVDPHNLHDAHPYHLSGRLVA